MALRVLSARRLLRPALFQSRGLQTFSLPDLPYDYGALEPAISGEIMQLHHQKHHQAYVTNYNKALEQLHDAISKGDSVAVAKLQSAIKFNGGGSSIVRFSFFDFGNFGFGCLVVLILFQSSILAPLEFWVQESLRLVLALEIGDGIEN